MKGYEVKEWFAAKKFKEIKGMSLFDSRVYAIFDETEKAYKCVLGTAFNNVITWVPKSLVSESEEFETARVDSYDEVREMIKDDYRMFA
nr:MAG TPA: hypothetical protein [Caudoviricetes sp.]